MEDVGLRTIFTTGVLDVGKEFYHFIKKTNSNNTTHRIIGYPPLCRNWVMC